MAELGENEPKQELSIKVASYSWMWQNRNKIKVVEPGEMDQTILTEAGIIIFF